MSFIMAAADIFDKANLPSVNFDKVFAGVVTVLELLVFAGILFGAFWFFIRPLFVYKTRVIILKKRGGKTIITDFDRGRFMKKDDMHVFKFLKNKKVKISQPDFKFIYSDSKGKPNLFLYQYGEQDYAPIQIDASFPDNPFIPVPSELRSLISLETLRINKKYERQRILDKILAPGMFIIAMVLIVVIFISLFKNMQSMAGSFMEGARLMAEAVASFNSGSPPQG